jgi:peroxin-5
MAFRDLTEPECAGQNSLMRLGSHVTRDVALKDEGLGRSVGFASNSRFDGNELVNEFLGQIVPPPQSFHMDVLLKEMREIDQQMSHRNIRAAPPVIEQVNQGIDWANEYGHKVNSGHDESLADAWKTAQRFQQYSQRNQQPPMAGGADTQMWTRQFFEINEGTAEDQIRKSASELVNTVSQDASDQINYSEFVKFMNDVSDGKSNVLHELPDGVQADDWIKDFEQGKQKEVEDTEQYNKQYWDRLQDEWKKIAGDDEASQHPWLSEFSDYYDPYKEYKFDDENPMIDVENAYEKAKAFLAQGDIPSAVLCLESAVKQDPENAEIWEVLGVSQAENEKVRIVRKVSFSLNYH